MEKLTTANRDIVAKINFQRLNFEFLTTLRINNDEESIKNIEFKDMNMRQQKCYCNTLLTILHEFYTIFLSDSFNRSKYFLENKAATENRNLLDFEKQQLIENHYRISLNLKELGYLNFLETHSFILRGYILEFLNTPNLFSKDPSLFNDQIETFNLETHEVNYIREFFIKFSHFTSYYFTQGILRERVYTIKIKIARFFY